MKARVPAPYRHTARSRERRLRRLLVAAVATAAVLVVLLMVGARSAGNDVTESPTRAPTVATGYVQESARGAYDAASDLESRRIDAQTEYDTLVTTEILQTLHDYEQISVDVPRRDPRDLPPGASIGERTRAYVRAPYWSFTKENEAKQAKSIAQVSPSLQEIFSHQLYSTLMGKGSPARLQATIQSALDTGEIRGANGAWPPEQTDIQKWMSYFGVGIDCSGFVYQALSNVDAALTSKGKPGLVRPLGGPPTDVDSKDIATSGESVARPDELRPGDVMNLIQPEWSDGHIRIISTTEPQGKAIVFTTAEAAETGSNGPDAKQWRFPDPAQFVGLEQFEGGQWHTASEKDQSFTYWRLLSQVKSP